MTPGCGQGSVARPAGERRAAGALGFLRHVRVGSQNPPKVAAVGAALAPYAPEASIEGVAVASGVPEQPVGFEEITLGARNRARAAWRGGSCDLSVGIEDGLVFIPGVDGLPLNVGCAVVSDGGRESVGFSSAFAYPPGCVREAVDERSPVGHLFDELWRDRGLELAESPSSERMGNVGRLSLGVLERCEYARHAVLCALVAFLHPDLYFAADSSQPSRSEETG